MSRARRILPAAAAALLLVGVQSAFAAAADSTLGERCASLTPKDVSDAARVDSVRLQAADAKRPETCAVHGSIVSSPTSTIHFRVDLPAAGSWNTKLLMVGGGGFDGFIPTENGFSGEPFVRDAERARAYAIASSDSGHQGRGALPMGDFSWVAGNPTALRNHAYAANHLVLWAAVDLARQFYGKAPARRYIVGQSNGGRAGLVAIQRYPADYDGVIALEPAVSQEGFAANLVPQMLQHIFASPDHWMSREQLALLERAELAVCDGLDGLEDGILGNPNACHYDASALQCKAGDTPSNDCLTAGQIESIRLILSDKNVQVPLADGVVGYPGYGRGVQTEDWVRFIFGSSFAARDAADFMLADNIVKHGITNDPNATLMTHDPTQWKAQYLALSNEIDATNPDLSAFQKHGGKLLVWYGLSDGCVTYKRTVQYLDAVKQKLGATTTREFMRLFTSPGVGHSGTGPGASSVELFTALENWVENGKAPDRLVAAKIDEAGKVLFTRPLCEYPAYPRYRGSGDRDAASSFECSTN